jgi:hypothetical protein
MDGMKETQLRFLAVSFSFEFTENTSELGYQFPRCAQSFGIRLKFVRLPNPPKAGLAGNRTARLRGATKRRHAA